MSDKSGWHRIDDPVNPAPKDGTEIFIGLWVNEGTPQAQWEFYRTALFDDDVGYLGSEIPWDLSDFSHWMRVPLPPAPDEGGE